MSDFTYSVAIRTVGKAGDKYIQELKSLHAQTIKPTHIYVFLAHGFERPKEQVAWRSMWIRQRDWCTSVLLQT